MGFSRQEYWSRLLFPSVGGLPDPVIEPGSPAFQADSLPELPGKPWVRLTGRLAIISEMPWSSKKAVGTSLTMKRLRLSAFYAGIVGWVPGQELRAHMPQCGQEKKKKEGYGGTCP